MKLPNADKAIVEIEKLRDYCLSPVHPRGRHKARVFHSVLQITAGDAEDFRRVLLESALREDAVLGVSDSYGSRYTIDFDFRRGERTAEIRSCWIVRSGEIVPRFVTCYIL